MHSMGASKPSGKATGWPRQKENTTDKVQLHLVFGQPNIECFGVLEVCTLQPMVFFSSVTDPSYQVIIPMTATPFIDDITNKIFFHAIFYSNG